MADSSAPSSLTISLVIYQSPPPSLETLFRSMASTTTPERICIVDNGGDATLSAMCDTFGFTYLRPPRNVGFGQGHNLAFRVLQAHGAKFHLMLNPDIDFQPEAVHRMVSLLKDSPDIVLAAPDILSPDGTRQYLCKLLPSPWNLILRRFLPSLSESGGENSRYELQGWAFDRAAEIPILSGCFLLVRSAAFRAIGGFDARYFLYLEDYDLCRRLHPLGKIVCIPEIAVTHHHGRGSYRHLRLLALHCQSGFRYFNRWGWWIDRERDTRNRACLASLGLQE